MILMIFFRIVDYFLINVCIFLGEGSGQMHTRICIVIMNRSMLNRKLRKKLGLLGFGSHSDLKYLLVTLTS